MKLVTRWVLMLVMLAGMTTCLAGCRKKAMETEEQAKQKQEQQEGGCQKPDKIPENHIEIQNGGHKTNSENVHPAKAPAFGLGSRRLNDSLNQTDDGQNSQADSRQKGQEPRPWSAESAEPQAAGFGGGSQGQHHPGEIGNDISFFQCQGLMKFLTWTPASTYASAQNVVKSAVF